ncbi:MAG TPA: ATP-grasp domain-containing protein [Solirubrobacteraceae bacterium]|jgi:glutathione synthase/RimK-type ligase-like ATP-grasp enzyme
MYRLWVLTDAATLHERMPAALVRTLEARGLAPRLVVADRAPASWRGLRAGDLVVARTRNPAGLALLQAAELHGGRTFDSHAAVRAVRNKAQATLLLARAGVPVPETVVAYGAAHAARLGFPMVVKPVFGSGARGVRIVHGRSELERLPWDGTPLLAQAYVATGSVDVQLCVAGERVWARRRPSPLVAPGAGGRPVAVTPPLRRLALACARRFGLALAGIDVLEAPGGPVVVDVDAFPDYAGIDEAPGVIADALVAELAERSLTSSNET